VSYGYGSSKLAFELVIDTYFDKKYPINIYRIGAISPRHLDVSESDQWLAIYYSLSHAMNCLCSEMDAALLPYADVDWLVDGIIRLSEVNTTYEVFHMHYPEAVSVNTIVDTDKAILCRVDKDGWAQKAITFCKENKSVSLSAVYSTINIMHEVISYLPLPNYTNAITTDRLRKYGELRPV
jgi:thioester reductase-like protein